MSKDNKSGKKPEAQPSTALVPEPKNKEIAVYDYGDDLGKGFENQGKDDKAIPFIAIAQALSKIVARGEARAGQLYNTVTGEVYGDHVYVVPAITEKRFAQFAPRDKGGGFRGQHLESDDVVVKSKRIAKETGADFGVYKTDNGDELVETFYVYCAVVDLDGNALGMAVIGFKKTQIKLYKKWQTRLGSIMVATPSGGKRNPPMFASVWKLSTYVDNTNPKGVFSNYVIEAGADDDVFESLLAPNDERYLLGKRMHELVTSGEAAKQVRYDSQADDGGGGGGAAAPASDPVF